MKLAIVGSRDVELNNRQYLTLLDLVSSLPKVTTIVSGGAKGADQYAKLVADSLALKFEEYPPDWKKYGRAAGPKRNTQILEASDFCIAILSKPLVESKGTQDTVTKFVQANKKVKLYEVYLDDSKSD